MFRKFLAASVAAFVLFPLSITTAHHSVLNYDGKREITITGTVTSARFGYPHSVYRIDVEGGDGETEKWTLSTEDPRDARQLGFADALKNLKRGDTITVVGWPDKFKKRTLRGHQLRYADGTVVMMRRGNYIWPRDMLRMDKMALNPDTIPQDFPSTDASRPAIDQVLGWIDEDERLTRMAREYADGRSMLIGLSTDDSVEYLGINELLECHTIRDGFTMTVSLDDADSSSRARIEAGMEYIIDYNNLLSRWWEQEHESCE